MGQDVETRKNGCEDVLGKIEVSAKNEQGGKDANGCLVGHIERLYDARLVRAFETQRQSVVDCDSCELGVGFF